HLATKAFGDLRGGLRAGSGDTMRQFVRIETRDAPLAKFLEDVALARRDPAGQCNSQHDENKRERKTRGVRRISVVTQLSFAQPEQCFSTASRSSTGPRRREPD